MTLLFSSNALSQNKPIDVTNDEGILFFDDTTTGKNGAIDYSAKTMGSDNISYLRLTADQDPDPDRKNNVVLTGAGEFIIGAVDPEDNYVTYSPDSQYEAKLVVETGTTAYYEQSMWEIFSDSRLKKNILPYKNGLNITRQINVFDYEYNGLARTDNSGRRHVGIIAQEMKEILPSTVSTRKSRLRPGTGKVEELYTFNGSELIYLAINSIKELDAQNQKQAVELTEAQTQIWALEKEVEMMKQEFAAFKAYMDTGSRKEAKQSFRPEQANHLPPCIPNPTSGLTMLPYHIDYASNSASIALFDAKGQLIQQFDIRERGSGAVSWDPGNLPKGIYNYTLIVDGTQIGSQRILLN